MAGLQRRDLRRTAVVRLAESGCEVPLIAAITGHSLKTAETILDTYFVPTYPMAQAAITKLEDRTRAQEAARNERTDNGARPKGL